MSAIPKEQVTYADYVAREEVADVKSEFYRGEIFAMSGGSLEHNSISVNIVANLYSRLGGSGCRPHNSDQRIRIPANGLATYPDASVVCGEPDRDIEDPQAINNPIVVFEVLSPSTQNYDRVAKFERYRELDSLQEYILVSQDRMHVERFRRQDDGTWVISFYANSDEVVAFDSIPTELPLSEIYRDIAFPPVEDSADIQSFDDAPG